MAIQGLDFVDGYLLPIGGARRLRDGHINLFPGLQFASDIQDGQTAHADHVDHIA